MISIDDNNWQYDIAISFRKAIFGNSLLGNVFFWFQTPFLSDPSQRALPAGHMTSGGGTRWVLGYGWENAGPSGRPLVFSPVISDVSELTLLITARWPCWRQTYTQEVFVPLRTRRRTSASFWLVYPVTLLLAFLEVSVVVFVIVFLLFLYFFYLLIYV